MNLTLLLSAIVSLISPADPRDGHELLALMRRQSTYRTLTFIQTTQVPGRPDQIWYESEMMPGRLRIDFSPVDSQRVVIYRGDSSYVMAIGRPIRARAQGNPLMILLGDVFVVPPETSAARLQALGVDLSKIRSETYEGRRTWVVGAAAGDSTSPQFWIDAERLYMVRLIEQAPGANGGTMDSRVTAHRRYGRFWVETGMVFYRNGEEIQREIYNSVTVNPPLDSLIFEPDMYRRPAWIPVTSP